MLNVIMFTACHLQPVECQPRSKSGIQALESVYKIAGMTNTFCQYNTAVLVHMFIAVGVLCSL